MWSRGLHFASRSSRSFCPLHLRTLSRPLCAAHLSTSPDSNRQKALKLALAEREPERVFFRCDYRAYCIGASVLLSSQWGLWFLVSYEMMSTPGTGQHPIVQSIVSASAIGLSTAALFAIPYLSKRFVHEISLQQGKQLKITTHGPFGVGATETTPLSHTMLLSLEHERYIAIQSKDFSGQNFLLDKIKGRFIGTDEDSFRALMMSADAAQEPAPARTQDRSQTTPEAIAAGPSQSNPSDGNAEKAPRSFAVTLEHRQKQYRNKKTRVKRARARAAARQS